ncbi:MAG: zf-HC2 domain-containing protein [Dehalococcoidia bacterium]|nr:zf-HC2 domain-containing protein [Dehalococcoidia bacterium]
MALTSFFRRHGRYRVLVDASADAELAPADAARMDAHLAACAECRAAVDAARVMKASVAALPEVAVPRSFRLTPAMVTTQRPMPTRAAAPGFLILARVGAAASIAAFAVVATLNFSSTGDTGDQTIAASAPAPESAELKSTGTEATNDDGAAAQDMQSQPGAASPPAAGGVSGAGVETPAVPATGDQPTPDAGRNILAGDGTALTDATDGPPANTYGLEYGVATADDTGYTPWLAGLGALAVAALGTLAVMEVRRRRH